MEQLGTTGTDTLTRPARRRKAAKETAGEAPLQLNREGDWMESEELLAYLLAISSGEDKAVLDMQGLTHVDAACFQVLISAAQSGMFTGGKVSLCHASEHVCNCFRNAGAEMLSDALEKGRS